MSAKELRRQKSAELSARASEIARYILFGVVALGYALFSGDSSFAKNMMANHATMLRITMILAFAGIFLDFVQYFAGYRAADYAFSNASGNYDYNEKSLAYRVWNLAFFVKQLIVLCVCGLVLILAVSIMFASAPPKKEKPPSVQYVTFEKGEVTVSDVHFTQLYALADAAKADDIKTVVIEGRADGVGQPDQNLRAAENRARSVERLLVEAGVPANKIRIRHRVARPAAGIKPGPAERAARIELRVN